MTDPATVAPQVIGKIMGVPSTTVGAVGIWSLGLSAILGIVLAWVKLRPKMRELGIGEDASLRRDLREDMQRMKEDHASEKQEMNRRYDALEAKLEARLDAKDAESKGEIARLRHQIGNTRTILNAFITRVEMSIGDPDKLREAVRLARDEASKASELESTESAVQHGIATVLAGHMVQTLPDPVPPKRRRTPRP